MRISDWSSDVCSSDLPNLAALADETELPLPDFSVDRVLMVHGLECVDHQNDMLREVWRVMNSNARRSEEHTSELQSLMRISYAVFCLKKKQHITIIKIKTTTIFLSVFQSYIKTFL